MLITVRSLSATVGSMSKLSTTDSVSEMEHTFIK